MKVLVITYYWPPAGGSGVQRWLKFVKYFKNFGVTPVVYTVKNPKYPIIDTSFKNDVPKNLQILCQPIWEPNNILSVFKNKKNKATSGFLNPNPNFFDRIFYYIRANYFIPDARKFWIKPSVRYLKKYLSKNKIDVIITTGPPHSLHLIGLQLKKELAVKWISDFRDPWTEIDYFSQLPFTKQSKEKHQKLEQEVLRNSDSVLVASKTMKKHYKSFSKNIYVLTNGYDTEPFSFKKIDLSSNFSLTHIGMMNAYGNPKTLWKVLSEICLENPEFKKDLELNFIGKVADEILQELKQYNLKNNAKWGYIPHKKVTEYQRKSQVLLLIISNVPRAKGIITGKIFEYLAAKRPILAIGPKNGDLADILLETQSGVILDFKDSKAMKYEILKLYTHFKKGTLVSQSKNIEKYHRKELTKKLSEIIKKV